LTAHSGGLKLKISVNRLSSRLCEGGLAVDPNGNWLTQGHLNPVTFSRRKQGGGVFKEARSPYFAYLKIDVAVTCQLFFGYHSKANSKTYPLIP
jgi:hypothetical protein